MFPFSGIVGQDELKLALMICAANPNIGGLLISGDKGTAKSTAVRGLAELLPVIEVRTDCRFNCSPDNISTVCEHCSSGNVHTATKSAPFIDLPLGATEDRVLGSLDFEQALKTGKKAFQPGLLASAHRGILYIDEVNLLQDHLVDVLLDVAASGVNKVERESITLSHPASFTLVGSMNPEEGELRPQFLDRFAMMVKVHAPNDPHERTEVLRRRIEFDSEPELFCKAWSKEQSRLRHLTATTRTRLSQVLCDDEHLLLISKICAELGIKSLRADIFLHKVAVTIAALDARNAVTDYDVRKACNLVLPHRVPKSNRHTDTEQDLQQKLDQIIPPTSGDDDQSDEGDSYENDESSDANDLEQVIRAANVSTNAKIEAGSSRAAAVGRRSTAAHSPRGAFVRTTENRGGGIAIDATIRNSVIRTGGALEVDKVDVRHKMRQSKTGNLIVFVVDASGSMAAMQRMKLVKGTALSLLQDAYQRRDHVAVVTFRGTAAELVLPPTRSITQAEQLLDNLPTGGTTPLTAALQEALDVIGIHSHLQLDPLIIVFTDGRANVSKGNGDPWEESLTVADTFAERKIASLVVDTEIGAVRLQRAGVLAERMDCEYVPLESLTSAELKRIIVGKTFRAGARL